ncbi:MAG: efflux RND transporter permease subunit, partial [Planctomycetota bacterium]
KLQRTKPPRTTPTLTMSSVDARLAVGAPVTEARRVAAELEGAARAAAAGIQDDLVAGIFTRVGNEAGQASELQVRAQLIDPGERSVGGADFARAWRAEVGRIVGTEAVTFSASSFGQGTKPIDVQLFGPEQELLERAAAELAAQVSAYAGVSDVDDGTAAGKRQLSFTLTPAGRAAGFTSTEVANQVRSAFFGAEALRQQRGRDEVKVIARLPRSERERLSTVENLILRTPAGGEMPLSTVATVDSGRSYTTINRRDGRRIVAVTAEVDPASASAGTILGEIQAEFLPDLARRYEGLRWSLAGEQESQAESLGALGVGLFLAMFVIFAMLAIPLKSYTLPMIVLSGAPFGVIGALLGHVVLGYGLSLMSLFGIIALTGVVVNDSLVLVVTAEGYRARGLAAFEAIRRASVRRLRPILLTSLTTSLGLLPMMLETSAQARFLVPMAISLGFGVLFSTFVILLLVPCLYLVREDLFAIGRVALGREAAPGAPETA